MSWIWLLESSLPEMEGNIERLEDSNVGKLLHLVVEVTSVGALRNGLLLVKTEVKYQDLFTLV